MQYINERMNRWAEWRVHGRYAKGLGFPTMAAFARLAPATTGARTPIVDSECLEVEEAFVACMATNAPLAQVLYLYHCRASGMTVAQMARECGCHRDTFYARVERGHQVIIGFLNDLAAGVPLPRPDHTAQFAA